MSYTRLDTDVCDQQRAPPARGRTFARGGRDPQIPPRLCLGMRPIQVYVGVFRSLIYSVRGALHRHRETVPTPRLRYVQVSLAQVDYLGKFGIAQVFREIVEFKGRREVGLDIFSEEMISWIWIFFFFSFFFNAQKLIISRIWMFVRCWIFGIESLV